MDKDEAGFGRGGIQAMFESADQPKVVVLKTPLRVFEAVVEERVRASIFHEGFEPGSVVSSASIAQKNLLKEGGQGMSCVHATKKWTYISATFTIGSAIHLGNDCLPSPYPSPLICLSWHGSNKYADAKKE